MRISDWSSDVCSSDLLRQEQRQPRHRQQHGVIGAQPRPGAAKGSDEIEFHSASAGRARVARYSSAANAAASTVNTVVTAPPTTPVSTVASVIAPSPPKAS